MTPKFSGRSTMSAGCAQPTKRSAVPSFSSCCGETAHDDGSKRRRNLAAPGVGALSNAGWYSVTGRKRTRQSSAWLHAGRRSVTHHHCAQSSIRNAAICPHTSGASTGSALSPAASTSPWILAISRSAAIGAMALRRIARSAVGSSLVCTGFQPQARRASRSCFAALCVSRIIQNDASQTSVS